MPEIIKTPEEILVEEKQGLFDMDIEESKVRQQRIIAQADNAIAEAQGQIIKHGQAKEKAQKLLDELEERYPTLIIEEAK